MTNGDRIDSPVAIDGRGMAVLRQLCPADDQPCYVDADPNEAHWRCGTVQCHLRPAILQPGDRALTIGDRIWIDCVRKTGVWLLVRQADAARWREFALAVVTEIDKSHGIAPDPEDTPESSGPEHVVGGSGP